MRLQKACGFCVVLLLCVFSSACFTIEKEIFLNADGSGELVLHVSVPDLPDDAKTASSGMDKNPAEEIEKFKKNVMTKLPPTVKLKEAKQVTQNGVLNFYAVLEFKDLKDTENILSSIGDDGMSDVTKGQAEWTSRLEKTGDKTAYTEKFLMDVSEKDKPPAAPKKTAAPAKGRNTQTGKSKSQVSGESPAIDLNSPEFGEKLQLMVLSLVKLRFVLHTPSPITTSNADIILDKNRMAVWNCSLLQFAKDKKPIEMKAIF
jgi:hypothetical protein